MGEVSASSHSKRPESSRAHATLPSKKASLGLAGQQLWGDGCVDPPLKPTLPMTAADPQTAPFIAAHAIGVRVYYEDTDLAGIVYHANYLKFFERARTDYLRDLGIDQSAMAGQGEGVFFAVRAMDIGFLKPARFDDWLTVQSMPLDLGGARIVLDQRILRDEDVLCTARVTVACVTGHGRPTRIPPAARAALQGTAGSAGAR